MSSSTDGLLWSVAPGIGGEQALRDLAELLRGAELHVGSFTDEELAVCAPVESYPLAQYPVVALTEPEVRDRVLGSALRSLVARDLLQLDDQPGSFTAVGSLGTVLALMSAPAWVVTVDRVAEFDPSRRVLHGLVVAGEQLALEEATGPLGDHVFTLRSAADEATDLARWLGTVPGWSPREGAPDGDPGRWSTDEELHAKVGHALDHAISLTRVLALRAEDDGDYSRVEAVVVDSAGGEQLVVVFTGDEADETMAVVPTSRVPLETFFAGVLAFDLGAVSAALPD